MDAPRAPKPRPLTGQQGADADRRYFDRLVAERRAKGEPLATPKPRHRAPKPGA